MTETELIDRLREAIVLDGPDAWRSNGYLQDAQQAGLSLTDALKQAAAISQEVSNNSILFQNIQARIARLAQPSRSHLIEQDLNQIVNAASSLKLSPDFVRNRWVPTVLQRLAAASAPQPATTLPIVSPTPDASTSQPDAFDNLIDSEPEPRQPEPVAPTPVPVLVVEPPVPVSVVEPSTPTPEPVRSPEPDRLASQPEPVRLPELPPVVRSFTATPARVNKGQPVTLAWEVENLLAVTIDDLGEGLSPTNRGWVKPAKTTDYTLFDANNNPLSTVRVEVIQPDRSGVYGVLFALALLAVIYWFIKNNTSGNPDPAPKRRTEQTTSPTPRKRSTKSSVIRRSAPEQAPAETEATSTRTEPSPEPVTTSTDKPRKEDTPVSPPTQDRTASAEPAPQSANPADARQGKYEEAFGDKPYDKVELGTDERGWRRARSNGRWGYINEADEWVIQPEYEAVTPFRGNTAAVFRNGQLLKINRAGELVRN